jgi:CRP/FNR family transcriptional regulator
LITILSDACSQCFEELKKSNTTTGTISVAPGHQRPMDTKHVRAAATAGRASRPVLHATSFGRSSNKARVQILTEKQQTELGSIATEVTFRRRVNVYHADSPAHSVFIVKDGMVKAFQDLPSGRQRVLAFLFPGDVFGLAENGLYVNSTATVAPTTCFEIPIDALTGMFRRDGELELQFLIKMTHELREAQRQQIILTRRGTRARVAMFLRMLQRRDGTDSSRIELVMSHTDIARYLGLSSESVSRAFARLSREGVVAFPNRHAAQILNRSQFDRLALAA